ncbi:MAG TPA: hypothetical protein VHQ68_09080, partial [Propionibacteriaceae bacterium]|nr:hypothetical protein [Propionibacteriaceae bacterium]
RISRPNGDLDAATQHSMPAFNDKLFSARTAPRGSTYRRLQGIWLASSVIRPQNMRMFRPATQIRFAPPDDWC